MVFISGNIRAWTNKEDFDKYTVLDRMELQLKKINIPLKYIKNIDLSWAKEDLTSLTKKFTDRDYILIFPFCSKNIKIKNGLILKIWSHKFAEYIKINTQY